MCRETHAFVTLARIVRPHGARGEVAAEILTDFPEHLPKLTEVFLTSENGVRRTAQLKTCWLSHSRAGQAIFHFEGCNSIDDAERLRGLEIQVPMADRVALPAGRYYVSDLIGCEVVESSAAAGQAPHGIVRDVQFPGKGAAGTPLLVVESSSGLIGSQRGELLIPLAEDICTRIDIASRRIEVTLPEGLLDLNRE